MLRLPPERPLDLNNPERMDRLILDVSRELQATEDSVARADDLLSQFRSGFQGL